MYTYDLAGNITRKATFDYTLDDEIEMNSTAVVYTYGYVDKQGNIIWGDLLTGYGDYTITSDAIGNPLEVKQGNTVIRSYSWEHGRQLASLTEDGTTWNYTYNTAGLRTERTNGSKTYTYTYNGSQLTYMTVDGHTLWFSYDAHGPMYVKYDGTTYLYVTNLQGDIIAIVNNGGTAVVEYTYDAWGNILDISGSMASSLGAHNPLRYRGYVYDTETTLYYLQSRYYDPEMGRFINADSLASTGQGLLGNNMFAYCGNNPVVRADASGEFFFTVLGAVVGAVSGALDSLLTGGTAEDIAKSAIAGAVSGAVSGAGVDIGVAVTAATGGAGIGAGVAIAGMFGAAGAAVGTGISTDWKADPMDYAVSALVGGMTNMVSFGLAPVNGEIAKGTCTAILKGIVREGINDFGMNVATGGLVAVGATWITRVVTNNYQSTRMRLAV